MAQAWGLCCGDDRAIHSEGLKGGCGGSTPERLEAYVDSWGPQMFCSLDTAGAPEVAFPTSVCKPSVSTEHDLNTE